MIVSKSRICDQDQDPTGPRKEAALSWLQRQLAWEEVLNELRRAAGVGGARLAAESALDQRAAPGGSRSAA